MIKLALIGRNISHSRSQEVYESLLGKKISYDLLDYPSAEFIPSADKLLSEYIGVSITSPYKKHFLEEVQLTAKVQELGSINCLYKHEGKIYGANTDYIALEALFPKVRFKSIALLGDGSMSKLCQNFLKSKGLVFDLYTRQTTLGLSQLDLNNYELVINCCSREFLYEGTLKGQTLFWDMNYNLKHPGFIENYQDGLEFLRVQAQKALVFWHL